VDSLTQIVLGAAVGEATLGKRIGNKALLYGAIAGTIPDLDVLAGSFTDTITAIEWHRGFSHSLIFCLLLAPLLAWVANKIERRAKVGWKGWTRLFFWCLFTHPLLDIFTTWGTQLFWPLDYRIAFNSIFVVDPLYTLPFLLLTVTLMFYKRGTKIRTRLNKIALYISTSYLIITLFIKAMVTKKFESALEEQGINYTAISTRPSPFNTILWNANIDSEEEYLISEYSFLNDRQMTFKFYPKNREASNKLLKYPGIQRLIKICNGWYILEEKQQQWYFYDLRFGLIPQKDQKSVFTFAYEIQVEGTDIAAKELPKTNIDPVYLLESLWLKIIGN
jgi:inner membrane protein